MIHVISAQVDPLMAIPGLMIYGPLVIAAVVWFLLPFFLISKLNRIIRHLASIESAMESVERHTRPASTPREKPAAGESSISYHAGR